MSPTPRRGALAYCSEGHLGLIIDDSPQPVLYANGETALAWHGVHLGGKFLGQLWSSRNPTVVGHIDDLQAMLGWTAPPGAVGKLITALRTHYTPDGRYYGPSNRMIGWVQEALELFEEAK